MFRRLNVPGLCMGLAVLFAVLAAESASAKLVSCQFYNYTSRLVVSMHMSLPGKEDWGRDMLTSSVVDNGESYTFSYEDDFDNYARFVDIKMVCWDKAGDIIFRNIDLQGMWRMSIFWNSSSSNYSLQKN